MFYLSVRGKLTPTFTSGKLKAMFSTLVDCGSTLQNHLTNLADKNELLDVREISASHATNVIASVAFGIDVDTINNPNNDFRVCGRQIFELSLSNLIRTLLAFTAPKLLGILRIKSVRTEVETFIKTVVKQTLEYRERNNISRKDFFQLLIQLRNNGMRKKAPQLMMRICTILIISISLYQQISLCAYRNSSIRRSMGNRNQS